MSSNDNAESRELKPCPFCGYKHLHLQRQSLAADMCPDETPENERVLWRIGCGQCGAEINSADTREQVVGIWNTRIQPTRPQPRFTDAELVEVALGTYDKHMEMRTEYPRNVYRDAIRALIASGAVNVREG